MSIKHDGFETPVESIRLRDFPDTMLGTRNRALTSLVSALQPGEMVLDAKQFYGVLDPDSLRGTFVEDQNLKKGRTCSAHRVNFGQLVLESVFDQELPTFIAVKPFPSKGLTLQESPVKALVHEWAATEYVAQLSRYERTYLPLGLWKRADKTPQLITLFDESSQSFDNVFWARGKEAEKTGPERIVSSLQLCVYALGIMHGAGLTHGDPQVKNFARDSKHIRFIDLTEVELMEQDAGVISDSRDNKRAVGEDFKWLSLSALDQVQRPNDMFDKVADVITNEKVLLSAVRFYERGIAQGGHFSDVVVPKSVVLSPKELIHSFMIAYVVQCEKYGKPISNKVLGAISGKQVEKQIAS
jgi:hypothetical protein